MTVLSRGMLGCSCSHFRNCETTERHKRRPQGHRELKRRAGGCATGSVAWYRSYERMKMHGCEPTAVAPELTRHTTRNSRAFKIGSPSSQGNIPGTFSTSYKQNTVRVTVGAVARPQPRTKNRTDEAGTRASISQAAKRIRCACVYARLYK